jgi:hypothetical protein
MATISPHDAENAMSQPSGSLDAQSSKRNVGGCSQIVDPRSHKEGIRRHVLLHENRISDYWTGRRCRQVSDTLRIHGDWKSWGSTSRFHCIWYLLEACRSALHGITLAQSQAPGDRPQALEACFLRGAFVLPTLFRFICRARP